MSECVSEPGIPHKILLGCMTQSGTYSSSSSGMYLSMYVELARRESLPQYGDVYKHHSPSIWLVCVHVPLGHLIHSITLLDLIPSQA